MSGFKLTMLLLLLLISPPAVAAITIDEAVEQLEQQQMRWLHQQQTRPGVVIDRFNSDGCSGGMSAAWETLADAWPKFAQAMGNNPPWEYCCVAHDRHYWRGETIDGFAKRLAADRELQSCVEQSGTQHSAALATRAGLSQAEVSEVFNLAAELMFHAVRLGGGPCTGLGWRWGHGWPACLTSSD